LNSPENKYLKKPEWLRIKLPRADHYQKVKNVLDTGRLHTICESGACPNKGECWGAGTATFMILGDTCTRSCRFCNVKTGKPLPPDPEEPARVASAVASMNVKHCVVTSVDRDDLPDGGAAHWAQTIQMIRKQSPATTIEALIPDFKGVAADIQTVIATRPEVLSHNLETVERLTREVRVYANFRRSLEVIALIAASGIRAKSGIMLGLGETEEEIFATMDDLLQAGCQVLTLGQYLQPTRKHLPVQKYIHPDDFIRYGQIARQKGFRFVESAPLVRSSYHAEKHV
jgi:lipoyl synthase